MTPKLNNSIRFALRMRTQRAYRSSYLCLLVVALAGAAPSFATTWTVTDTSDSLTDQNSLRYAIANAASGDTITFKLPNPSTIKLTNGVLTISNNLTITGPGAMQLAIDGNQADRVFYINSGVTASISGLTIQNGNTPGDGAGIYNDGTLTLTNATLSGNGDSNFTVAVGGGIYNSGTAIVNNSTLTGNTATYGGGVWNQGTMSLTNSTIADNLGAYNGGIENTSMMTITNSTVASNSTFGTGTWAGIRNGGALTIKSTLLAGNRGSNCSGGSIMTSAGYNLSDDTSCEAEFTLPNDVNNTPAQLDPKGLQNNGGPTQTIALLSTSPAVDAIPVSPVNECTDTNGEPVTTDQRGVTRPQGSACDVGAYELIETVPFSSFNAYLAIATGRHPGFVMTSVFRLGSGASGLTPANEAMTLKIASYTLTLPAGSFHQLWKAPNAPYVYEGTLNGANLVLGIVPLGNNEFQFDAAGSPVAFTGVKNPVPISLTFGNDSGTTSVNALITQ